MKTEMLTGAAWLWSLAAAGSVTMQPCTSPASQQTTCYEKCGGPRNPSPTAGMFQFKSHPGTCLAADPTTKLLITASCNKSDGYQRFNNFGGLLLQGAHSDKACITANCTIHNSTSVECEPGAPLRMEPCVQQWPGSPIPVRLDLQLTTTAMLILVQPVAMHADVCQCVCVRGRAPRTQHKCGTSTPSTLILAPSS